MAFKLDKCCYCTLRLGTQIISILNLIGAVAIVITAALNVRDALLQLSDGKTPSVDPTFDNNLRVSLGLSIAQLTLAILMIACFSLVIDAPWEKQKPKFLILWLVGNALSLIGSILIVYLLVAQGSYGALTSTAVLSLQRWGALVEWPILNV